jgi:hypothetical protein
MIGPQRAILKERSNRPLDGAHIDAVFVGERLSPR